MAHHVNGTAKLLTRRLRAPDTAWTRPSRTEVGRATYRNVATGVARLQKAKALPQEGLLVSLSMLSWNRIIEWLNQMAILREATCTAT